VATQRFVSWVDGKAVSFDYGTILIPKGIQPLPDAELDALVAKLAQETGIDVQALSTGLAQAGIDAGSPSFEPLEMPVVGLLGGEGASSYEVGEAWHLLDQRYGMPAAVIDQADLEGRELRRYTVLVLVNGQYGRLNASAQQRLKQWVQDGGVLLAIRGGAKWASDQGLSKIGWVKAPEADSTSYRPYAQLEPDLGSKELGGSIFQAIIDPTHPLCYGYERAELPVFRQGTRFARKSANPYGTPLRYGQEPLLSGYIASDVLQRARGTAGIVAQTYGRGRVVSMLDNPNFRAFWVGTNKLFANALFFAPIIDGRAGR
jgi:hypothetical protein